MNIQIGKYNELKVVRRGPNGIYLDGGERNRREDILLPKKEVPENIEIGHRLRVFVYRDSDDRMIATLKKPFAQVGELAYLKVVDTTRIGAFLDWGLEKDLFMPLREQSVKPEKDKNYLVKVYVDKSNRLCATMKIDGDLFTNPPFQPGDIVNGTVYGVNSRVGVFIAIENHYYGFVPNAEKYKEYKVGDQDRFRVIRLREDGRVDLSTRQLAHRQMEEDGDQILQLLAKGKGFLPLNDKSTPEEIKKYLSISKNAFKRAVGRLMKEKKVSQDEKGIWLLVNMQIKDLKEKD